MDDSLPLLAVTVSCRQKRGDLYLVPSPRVKLKGLKPPFNVLEGISGVDLGLAVLPRIHSDWGARREPKS